MVSVCLSIFTSHEIVGEFHTRCGVDIQSSVSAPGGEGVRVYVRTFNNVAIPFEFLFRELCALQPLVEGVGELVAVFEDFPGARVVLASEPCDADGSDGLVF